MRIYSMTATFGKLEHETLTLQPGLNIIQAPNEWGKSTWCAFLAAMLFGLDTRAKSTKTALADKERYLPWSGSPMEGRIDLNWQGRDITIERKTKRRVPLGEFRAYETQTGMEIPELNAANCGSMLLGVERSVFLRSGFIRFSDLPVSQDEALRRRLNALVTTGDESSTGDRLAGALRDLKNRCRYHKNGLLPQAEAERSELESKIREIENYETQCDSLRDRLGQIGQRLEQLENHRAALQYQAAQADAGRVAQAEHARNEAQQQLREAQTQCEGLPSQEQAQWALNELRKLEQQWLDLQMEEHMAPREPEDTLPPPEFMGLDGEAAIALTQTEGEMYARLKRKMLWLLIPALIALLAGGVLAMWNLTAGTVCAACGAVALAVFGLLRARQNRQMRKLEEIYGSKDPAKWLMKAKCYAESCREYDREKQHWREVRADLDRRLGELREKISHVTHDRGLESCRRDWEQTAAAWDALAAANRELQRSENLLQTLRSMAKNAPKPGLPDTLSYTEGETIRMLSDSLAEQHMLQNRLSQYQGRMETLGQKESLQAQLEQKNMRIAKLEDTFAALTLAQETLTRASAELQRRFAPRIAQRAQELMGIFTGGRYDRLTLGEDLSVRAGAEKEATLREAVWRSDGTIDQLYLSLRLAVAQELTPEAPLILDDALVRFDDTRLKAAMEILAKISKDKQVILFTCQSRENARM